MRGPYPKGRERRSDSTDALTRQRAGKLNIKRASGHDGARKSPHGETAVMEPRNNATMCTCSG